MPTTAERTPAAPSGSREDAMRGFAPFLPARTLALEPFGRLIVPRRSGVSPETLLTTSLRALALRHRLLVLRGFRRTSELAFARFARDLDAMPREIDEVASGSAGDASNLIAMRCDLRGSSTELATLFTDTTEVVARAARTERARWARVRIVDETARCPQSMLDHHPITGEAVLRRVERSRIDGVAREEQGAFREEMARTLRDPAVCYRHEWRDGDVVIADAQAVLGSHDRRRHST